MRVIQISDSHLFADPAHTLLGINTEQSLAWVIEQIKQEQTQIDCILATGDIAQDAQPESYQRFQQHLQAFNAPVYWLPGNHDEIAVIAAVVNDVRRVSPCVVECGKWKIILLDSSVAHEVWGHLANEQLLFLHTALENAQQHHVMVCLHHHPVLMQSRWLDGLALKNNDAFFSVLDQFNCVRVVVWGHVHQDFYMERRGVKLFATPSTCIQFKPQSEQFALEGYPGYRWFDLLDDGEIVSGVSRITPPEWPVDVKSVGY